MSEWQPIETAPVAKNVLVAFRDGGVSMGWKETPAGRSDCWYVADHVPLVGDDVPTHWMPLPDPPK